ncbi:MAG: S9 family peptidase [Candidatus Eisenbacteria bacterium]|nr:S9 family peptidase [Candidatus Eisenbacteria bacterium]
MLTPRARARGRGRVAVAALAALAALPVAAAAIDATPDANAPAAAPDAPPATRIAADTDTLHGRVIPDPYRWLEDWTSPESSAWIDAQEAYAEAFLGACPARDDVRRRLGELLDIPSIGGLALQGDRLFFTRRNPENEQPVLCVRVGDAEPRALIDPSALGSGVPVSLDWWHPSENGLLLAYGTSEGGSEMSVLRVMDVDSGTDLRDEIPYARAAGVAWEPDGNAFYYSRFPAPGDVPPGDEFYYRRIYRHVLGDEAALDKLVFGDGLDKRHWPSAALSTDGRFLFAYVWRGGARNDIYVKDLARDDGFRPLVEGLDARFTGIAVGSTFYMMTSLEAPNFRILRVDLENPARLNWQELVPESDLTLQSFLYGGGHLCLLYLKDAHTLVRVHDAATGAHLRDVPLPEVAAVYDWAGDWRSPEVFFGLSSYLTPPTVLRYDATTGALREDMAVEAPLDPSPYVERQVWYESKDGTRIPMFLAHRRDIVLDGNNPTMLVGYGGFGSSVSPGFARNRFLWFERGGVYAEACLRGGGEYGDAWHRAGMLADKQNTFDDFIAAAEWLVAEGITSPERLAVWGGSNGGLLVGAFLTQRPDLAAAVICDVPLLDMTRFHRFYIGDIWSAEYGSPDDPEQFEWLYAYSPYHRVRDGVAYPAVYLTTAESDTRVHPSHALKMTARLQAASASGRPVLLRFQREAGHGLASPMRRVLAEYVDYYSFLFRTLGMTH